MCSSVPSEQIEGAIWEMSCDSIYEREANVSCNASWLLIGLKMMFSSSSSSSLNFLFFCFFLSHPPPPRCFHSVALCSSPPSLCPIFSSSPSPSSPSSSCSPLSSHCPIIGLDQRDLVGQCLNRTALFRTFCVSFNGICIL